MEIHTWRNELKKEIRKYRESRILGHFFFLSYAYLASRNSKPATL